MVEPGCNITPVSYTHLRRTLQDYRSNGILPYIQVGGKILYRASDIERTLMDLSLIHIFFTLRKEL